MSRRQHGRLKSANPEEQLRQEAAVFLSPEVEQELASILQRRESTERELERLDMEVYDLESSYLKHCVSYGGSLFDGFGLERHANAHRNSVSVLTPLTTSSSSIGGGGSAFPPHHCGPTADSAPCSPMHPTAANDEHSRTYRILSSCFSVGGGSGRSNCTTAADLATDSHSPGSLTPLANVTLSTAAAGSETAFQVASKGSTAPAFNYRIHFFSPSERVFSACSVGALSRVEVAKSILAGSKGVSTCSTWSTAATAVGRGGGLGKRGRRGSNEEEGLRGKRGGAASHSSAFDRQPKAPPRQHQRYAREEVVDYADDGVAENGSGDRYRRRRLAE
ncbi:hypothetical protein JKF63_04231 [Porcisia hertigi]|uniref:Uncharacterized protein n=1 Tax=Porcisia hertigi TaxID=2761500 RepID=A0A836HZR4_9TRYP|nr:hypothetical protein JKF63_04231 [Porcisia hertigi]